MVTFVVDSVRHKTAIWWQFITEAFCSSAYIHINVGIKVNVTSADVPGALVFVFYIV